MDGWDFLLVAENLARSSLERDLRTAVGRAYYALYNGLAEPLRERGIPISEEAAGHAELWKWMRRCGDPVLRFVAGQLGTLRSRRNDADYRMALPTEEFSPSVVALLIDEVRKARRTFERIGADAAAKTLREYLARIHEI